jgi:hypothetical protein
MTSLQPIKRGVISVDVFDVEAAERAEKSIDAFILKRSRSQEAANREEALWAESTRRFNHKRRHQNAQAWFDHHNLQLASHEATFGQLVAYHRGELARYAEVLGIEVAGYEPEDGPEAA